MSKEHRHKNGYIARLYGKSSLSVYFNGKEVLYDILNNIVLTIENNI